MRKVFLVLFISFAFSCALSAQHPLEGTWEMVSIRGINADDEKFYLDTTTVRETKIITATHYILLARDREDNRWTFNRCYAGTVKMDGTKYYEYPVISSLRIFENVITDFQWKIERDRFIQTGTITRPDGKKIVLEEFIFRRTGGPSDQGTSSYAGTWSVNGPANTRGLLILTPGHWMKIIKNEDKLINAAGGAVSKTPDPIILETHYQSDSTSTSSHRVEKQGDPITVDGISFEKL